MDIDNLDQEQIRDFIKVVDAFRDIITEKKYEFIANHLADGTTLISHPSKLNVECILNKINFDELLASGLFWGGYIESVHKANFIIRKDGREFYEQLKNPAEKEIHNIQNNNQYPEYDIVFSFAGEDRRFVENIIQSLEGTDIKYFYDKDEESSLWGKDLYEHLDDIYSKRAKYCVMIISQYYAKKLWTNHERKSAQAKAFLQNEEYILPIRLDNSEIPGIRPTLGYLDGKVKSPAEIAKTILDKLSQHKGEPNFGKSQNFIRNIKDNSTIDEVNGYLKRVYNNSEKLSVIIADCLLFAKKLGIIKLIRFCTVELNGMQKGESYPDSFYRKIEVFGSIDKINLDFIGWGDDISKAIDMIENTPERFTRTKTFAWQPINEIEEKIQENNLDKKLVYFKISSKDLHIGYEGPETMVNFYTKAIKFKDLYSRIRNKLTEILVEIINENKD